MKRVAIVGAGLAGATAAAHLAQAGFEVTVFEKSRGPGGRMATRRAHFASAPGSSGSIDGSVAPPRTFDHGVPGWTAASAEFQRFLHGAEARGVVARWTPRRHPHASLQAAPWWVGTPDMPALARWMLANVPVRTECRIDALERTGSQWQLKDEHGATHGPYDAALLAIPAPQAAPLWAPHEPGWAATAKAQSMSPCWTLMAATEAAPSLHRNGHEAWDLWEAPTRAGEPVPAGPPPTFPLERIIRQDAKPGRPAQPALQQWVAHASPAWSEAHLEADAAEVLPHLQAALLAVMAAVEQPDAGWHDAMHHAMQHTVHHAVVHRWRYAQSHGTASAGQGFQWNPNTGLGGCADWLGGGGVEGAWHSGRALAEAMSSA